MSVGLARRLSAFAGAGALGFLVDAGLTELLVLWGTGPLVARVIAVAAAMTTTFAMNRKVTWRSEAQGANLLAEAGRYLAVALSASAVNYAVYAALMLAFPGLRPFIAVAAGSAAAMVVSYLGFARLVFAGR